jgi:C-terminal processing protease CtpA/Prc
MHMQKRQMAWQCDTLVAERDLARKQRDALQERVEGAESLLDKALKEMPHLRGLEQMHLSCEGSLEAEKASLKVAQEEVQRLQAIEVQHKACPDSLVNLENMIQILRRKVTDCEEAADKRQERLEQALQVGEQAHEQRLKEMEVLRKENQALREKSEDSTLTRSSLKRDERSSPLQPVPPPLPGNTPPRRLCGVGLYLAVYDDFHFKAGSIYVEEVMAGGAAECCGLVSPLDVLVSVNDKAITQLSQVYSQITGFEGSQVVLELERKGLRFRVRLTRKEMTNDRSSLLSNNPLVPVSGDTKDTRDFVSALPFKKQWDQAKTQ